MAHEYESGFRRRDGRSLTLREVAYTGQTVEVGILRPEHRVASQGSRVDDAVDERKPVLEACRGCFQGQGSIEVDDLSLLHHRDALQRGAFVTLLRHTF